MTIRSEYHLIVALIDAGLPKDEAESVHEILSASGERESWGPEAHDDLVKMTAVADELQRTAKRRHDAFMQVLQAWHVTGATSKNTVSVPAADAR